MCQEAASPAPVPSAVTGLPPPSSLFPFQQDTNLKRKLNLFPFCIGNLSKYISVFVHLYLHT